MAETLTQEQIANVLLGIKIPPQPQILVDLQIEQIMPDPDIKRIASLIRRDVGLAGTVLKVVNSSFYGLSNKITSVDQAVSLIGLDSVINIINGVSIKSEMSDETITHMNRFWDTARGIRAILRQQQSAHYRYRKRLIKYQSCGGRLLHCKIMEFTQSIMRGHCRTPQL